MTEDIIAVSIGTFGDVTGRIVLCTFTQRPVTDGLDTWQLILDNYDGILNSAFSPDDPIIITINSVDILTGYVDKRPMKLRGVCENQIYLSGRGSDQDLQNKLLWSLYAHTDSFSGKADDIIQDMLSKTSSEITFVSPSAAPEIYYSSNWAPLNTQFKDVLELINYAGFVDKDFEWQMWPIATGRDSGITLKSLTNDPTNNVIGNIDYDPGDSTDVRNYLIVQGPKNNDDSYTEMSASYWTAIYAGDVLSDFTGTTPQTPVAGAAAIKCTSSNGVNCGCKLDFPSLWHWYLDFHLVASDDLKVNILAHFSGSLGHAHWLKVYLTDSLGNVMSWNPDSGGIDKFKEITVKIGYNENDNADWTAEVGDKADFNWLVTQIKLDYTYNSTIPGIMEYILIDRLQFPHSIVAANDQTSGSSVHTLRTYVINRSDITTQVELQQYADQLGPKLALPIPSLNLMAQGNIGLISGAWKWLAGYYATVRIQDGTGNYVVPNNSKWRFMELTHTFDPAQRDSKGGHVYSVDLKMVPYDLVVNNQNWNYGSDPEVSVLRRLRDRLRYIENTQSGTLEPQEP